MKTQKIQAAGLQGATLQGGWSSELNTEDCVHTLIAMDINGRYAGLKCWRSMA